MLQAMTGFLIGSLEQPEEVYKVGQQSVRLLLAFGDLIVAWLLGRQAEVAGRALDEADTLSEPTATSTPGSWPRRGSSPPRCCPAWRATARSSRRPPTT